MFLALTICPVSDIIIRMSEFYYESERTVPSFAKAEAYDFERDDKNLEVYRELNEIAEEIEKCRRKNC